MLNASSRFPISGNAPASARIGVVVLTYNRRDELARTLDHLWALPERPPITVVDNASSDGTRELVHERYPEVAYVRLEMNAGAAGRNAGIEAADRPYIALCDDDTWWAPGSLERAADLLDRHARLAVVTAKVLVGEDAHVDPTCIEMAHTPLPARSGLPGVPLLGFLAGASVLRRDAFLNAGGFNPRFFLGGEEELLALDLAASGWDMAYVEQLLVYHLPSPLRDPAARYRLLMRNALWVTWLRRPLKQALRRTWALLQRSRTDATARVALIEACWGLPWALSNRRPLPEHVEAQVRLLERQRGELADA